MLIPVFLVLTAVLPPSSTQAPWKFTLEERIALRTNVDLARKRVMEAGPGKGAQSMGRVVDRYDGKKNPELFLPFEVFRTLIVHSFADDLGGETFRRGFMAEAGARGLPPDFWDRLKGHSARYIADLAEERSLLVAYSERSGGERRKTARTLKAVQARLCGSRADALDAARKEFGYDAFDRFLYEVIAPGMFSLEDELPTPAVLRWIAGGCK